MKSKWKLKKNQGVQPVAGGTLVDVLTISNRIDPVRAGDIMWHEKNSDGELYIVSWRLHVEEAEEVDQRVSGLDEQVVGGKQPRYTDDAGMDLIDEWARTETHETFRKIMYAMIQKYNKRLGKKAPIQEETAKMLDYMSRWHEYELIWANE